MLVSRSKFVKLAVVSPAMGLLAAPATAQEANPAPAPGAAPTREVRNTGLPEMAPGYELTLTRVTIPAGAIISAHMHSGMQLAHIESGTVHYTVVSGAAPYTRNLEDVLQAGDAMDFGPGDRITELPGMVHIAKNLGDEPVVIYTTSLFVIGMPTRIPVEPVS